MERIATVLLKDAGPPHEYLDHILEEALTLTGSKLGYIYHYDEDTEQFVLNSWSNSAMAGCAIMERQTVYMLKHTGLWGEAVRQRKPVVTNHFETAPLRKGLPPGHVSLQRFLTLPVMVDEKIVGVVGVANKPSDYDDTDILQLTLLMSAVWKSILRRKAEQDYQTLFHEMINGFAIHGIVCDQEGRPVDYRFLDANPAFERMTGMSLKDIRGKLITEVLPTIERKWIEIYGKVALTGEPVSFEESVESLGKTFEVVAFRPSPGKFATFFVDVTEREKARMDLRASEERLRQSEKMEALGMLAGGIAHDFNNILGAIQGFSELSLAMSEEGSPIQENLAKILRSGNRARKLVQQIQTYSRAAAPRKIPVRIATLIEEAVEQLRGVAAPGVVIETTLDRPAFVDAEPTQIHEVFLNLGMNALQAIGEAGRLSIRQARVTILTETVFKIGVAKPGEHVLVEFADTGCGMDTATLRKAFDPFFTTRRTGGGSGLGLSVVQGIVQAHGFALDLVTRVGEGTVFRLLLPLSQAEEGERPSAEPAPSRGKGELVLVVDDEAALLDFYQQALSFHGYEVQCASSGNAALELLAANPSSFRLLLTDQSMPGMSGAELARHARRLAPSLPVLMCTGQSPDITESRAREIGIQRILSKPIQIADLSRHVREALDRPHAEV